MLFTDSTIYVGNLTIKPDIYQLFDMYKDFGRIKNILVRKSSRKKLYYGFIEFDKIEQAAKAILKTDGLYGKILYRKRLDVDWARKYRFRNKYIWKLQLDAELDFYMKT